MIKRIKPKNQCQQPKVTIKLHTENDGKHVFLSLEYINLNVFVSINDFCLNSLLVKKMII